MWITFFKFCKYVVPDNFHAHCCPGQHSCKFLFLIIFFANCSVGYSCPQILQIIFLDNFSQFDMVDCISNLANCYSEQLLCKLLFWGTILQIFILDDFSNVADCRCEQSCVLQIVTSENLCSASILLNFGKIHFC